MHLEALTNEGKKIFPHLREFPEFYLSGGTALALQIGHRVSVDFDFFCEGELPPRLLAKLKKVFPYRNILPSVNDCDELTVFADGIKLSFIRYPFPTLFTIVKTEGIRMLSVKEIAATKAYTIGRRREFKDYVDLYFCVADGHCTLSEIIDATNRKFGAEFNDRLFLEQLVYLDDLPSVPLTFLARSVTRQEILDRFESEIQELDM